MRARAAALLLCAALLAATGSAQSQERPVFAAIGDSLTAGFQNFSLVGAQQETSFANLISLQAGAPMTLPLINKPGFPIKMALRQGVTPLSSLKTFIDCTTAILALPPPGSTAPPAPPVPGSVCEVIPGIPPEQVLFVGRQDGDAVPTNLAVPGMTVHEALTKGPGIGTPPSAVDFMASLILASPPGSQVGRAVALNPVNALVWLGANDVLMAGLSGDFRMLTRLDRFYSSYRSLMAKLATTDANLIVANLPDVTAIPYFMPAETLAAQSGRPIGQVTARLGIDRRDFLRPAAVAIAMDILEGRRSGRLPATCPATVPGLPFPTTPCVLKFGEAAVLRAAVLAFNLVILERAIAHHATLVDIYSLVNRIKTNGYIVKGKKLTMDYLGGFFSFDAVHPNSTGHAIIANEWIKAMNARLGMQIPAVTVQ
jgi:hypothetical protein